jgi:hypothetical protein
MGRHLYLAPLLRQSPIPASTYRKVGRTISTGAGALGIHMAVVMQIILLAGSDFSPLGGLGAIPLLKSVLVHSKKSIHCTMVVLVLATRQVRGSNPKWSFHFCNAYLHIIRA